MRQLAVFLITASITFATVTCTHPDGTANGSTTWGPADAAGRATCGTGFTRPVYYVIESTSYGSGITFNSTLFDKDMQAVFNDAQLGDKVLYTAGQEFIHGIHGGPRITFRQGTGTLEITTTAYAKLPNSGTRITPAYAPLMATIRTRAGKALGSRGDNVFVLPGGPKAAQHITFRGLRFTVKSDDDAFGWEMNGGLLNAGSSGRGAANDITSLTSNPVVGQNFVNVLSTDGFAVTDPAQQVVIAFSSNTPLYTVTGVNLDGANTIRVSPNISLTGASYKVWSILNREGESDLQPDDITVQHCVFSNPPPKISIATSMGWATKSTTVRDNWFNATFDDISTGAEPKILQAAEAYGPYTVENNYFLGAMAWMHGGQFSMTHAHMLAGGIWRYNAFHLPEELLFVNKWEVAFSTTSSYMATSEMSVDGLPAHSNRYVPAGRSVWGPPDSNLTAKWHWTAQNSGVVGTSKPACLANPATTFPNGTTNKNTAAYCYDSDPSRASRGTTFCPPQGTTVAASNPGDGVCWRLGFFANIIKNAWETKDSSNQLVQYNGFISYPPDDGGAALNTGQFTDLNIKISSAYYGNTLNYPLIYTQLRDITLPASGTNPVSGCFYDITAFPTPTTDEDGHVLPAGYSPWPFCVRAHGDNIAIRNNYFRNVSGGIQMVGFYTSGNGGHGMSTGPWEISGNLFSMRNPVEFGHPLLSISGNAADEQNPGGVGSSGPFQVPVTGILINNNTFYTPYNATASALRNPFVLSKVNTTVSDLKIYNGTRSWSGNVWASLSGGSFYKQNVYAGEGDFVTYLPGVTDSSGTATWGKNVALGAAQGIFHAAAYPAGTIYTGCATSAKCSGADALPVPDYSKIFVNPTGGDFRIPNDHTFAKVSQYGQDLGADPNQVPMINGLTVTPTDRSVLFQWRLTEVIREIPCVIELHTSPDIESTSYAGNVTGYAAELSDMATYYRQDADDADRNYRDGSRRMITLGYAVNLTADTPYYYRLHCGGDLQVGMFRTLPALAGTATQFITRTIASVTAASMKVEYGTTYSRATNTISGGGTAFTNCTETDRCTVQWTATKGEAQYYRFSEQSATSGGGSALITGKVEATLAQ
jgi:hypothetical protein